MVEGKYDKIKLSGIVDTLIIETKGFVVFKDKNLVETIKRAAAVSGIVILTDSDTAGLRIRNFVKQSITEGEVYHAYIPEIEGKERRKRIAGAEGILGVEGISDDIILQALSDAGCHIENESTSRAANSDDAVTKADFYDLGLTGCGDSAAERRKLAKELGIPSKISANMLIEVVNRIFTRKEFFEFINDKK